MIKVLSSKRIFDGKIVRLRVDEVVYPEGGHHSVEAVEHVGGVAIIAQPNPDEIILVEQYRPVIGRAMWEVPAGKLDPGEEPATCAARELEEETGYRCERVRRLWSFYTSPGFSDELLHLFLAEGLAPGARRPDDQELIQVKSFKIDDVLAMIGRDELPDAKTQIAVALVKMARR